LEEAEQIRQTANEAVELLLGERREFYQQWLNWNPPTQWIIPKLPANWNQIRLSND